MTRPPLILAASAAFLGAAGVALAAAAEHAGGGDLGRTAALFLILHAAAGLGVAAHARLAPASSRGLVAAGFAMEAGAALFAARSRCPRLHRRTPVSLCGADRRLDDDPVVARDRASFCGGGARR